MKYEEYDYIRGNTALAPKRKREERQRDNNKRRHLERQRAERKKKQFVRSVVGISSLCLVLGMITLTVDGVVFKKQAELSTLEKNYEDAVSTNEALNVQMIQFSSVEKIKDIAENDIGMVYADNTNTITIDMSKDFFPNIKEDERSGSNFLNKIKNMFN